MAWHLGYPLSQTLFTCVYVEALLMPNPRGIDEAKFVRKNGAKANNSLMLRILRAFCLGLLKSCLYVNERVKSEHSYEVTFSSRATVKNTEYRNRKKTS